MQKSLQLALTILFAIVMLDSFAVYILRSNLGIHLPINALLPIAVLLLGMQWGFRYLLPPSGVLVWLSICCIGFMLAVGLNPDIPWQQLLSFGSAVAAFVIGYTAMRWNDSSLAFGRVFFLVGSVYVLVCVIALLQLMPGQFPVVENLWLSESGIAIRRPEVTTDQNFQVFYLIVVPLLFALPLRAGRLIIATLLTIGALYVLIRLQTRSGVLVFVSALLLAWGSRFFKGGSGRFSVVVLPIILAAFVYTNLVLLLDLSMPLMERFTSEQAYMTLDGRLVGAQYLMENIWNPGFWLARGDKEFLVSTGNIPHFNPTAMYLQGGILALIAWVALVPIPAMKLGFRFLFVRLDSLGVLVFIGGTAVLVAQLALNAPLFEQVWLWAGAVIGVNERNRKGLPDVF